jgi:adenosine deaminase
MRSLPKTELHLHLDCCLSFNAAKHLEPSLTREEYDREFVAPSRCTNLADFLTRAPRGYKLMQSDDALRVATEDLFDQLAGDNVVYAELRFAPFLHTERGLSAEHVVEVLERATDDCSRATGVESRLILCTLRHFDEATSLATAELVERFRGSRVAALDLAGDEAGYPIAPHLSAYRYAVERNLHRTAHAGEASGPESVWETLRVLHPERIGHGVRSIEDPHLVEHLRATGMHLEICPSSNVQIVESIPTWPEHPVDRLYRAGVRLSISTDTRTITPATLNSEYENLAHHFHWNEEQFLATNLMAIDAAFAEADVKEKLRSRLRQGYPAASTTRNAARG